MATALAVLGLASLWLPAWAAEVTAVGALILILAYVLERPQRALFVFIVGLPLHNLLMALLFHLTGSVTFVRVMQPWKEAVIAVTFVRVVVPLLIPSQRAKLLTLRWPRLAVLDVLFMLFVVIAGVSVVLPNHLISLVGRLYGFRDLVVPISLYAIGRLAPLTRRDLRIFVGLLSLDVSAYGLAAIGERLFWGNGLVLAINYGGYLATFLGQSFPIPHNLPYTFYTDGYYPRAASLTAGPLDLSNLMLIALPILLAVRTLRNPLGKTLQPISLLPVIFLGGAALLLAWGRESLVLAACELALLLFLARPRWQWKGPASTLAGALLGLALLYSVAVFVTAAPDKDTKIRVANTGLLPLVGQVDAGTLRFPRQVATSQPSDGTAQPPASATVTPTATPDTGLNGLFHQTVSTQNNSTVSHLQSLEQLATLIARHPQGYGIGTAGQVSMRFTSAKVGGESAYLTVGVELGVAGLLVYLLVFMGAVWVSWRAVYSSVSVWERTVFLGVAIAWIAISLDGIFSEVTLNLFAMYVLSWMAGAAASVLQLFPMPSDAAVNV